MKKINDMWIKIKNNCIAKNVCLNVQEAFSEIIYFKDLFK